MLHQSPGPSWEDTGKMLSLLSAIPKQVKKPPEPTQN